MIYSINILIHFFLLSFTLKKLNSNFQTKKQELLNPKASRNMSGKQIKCFVLSSTDRLPTTESEWKTKAEKRLFTLVESDYNKELLYKLKTLYNNITSCDEIKTYWLDRDNDFVCFSTDAELKDAIRTSSSEPNHIFNVYVMLIEASKGNKSNNNNFLYTIYFTIR